MSRLPELPPLRDVIRRYDLRALRQLGQNFLLDLNLTRRIAAAAGDLTDRTVIEIGPGPGGLTRALLETAVRQVIAVERDPRCLTALGELETAADGRLVLIAGDALGFPAASTGTAPRQIVANLPYNIATPLLIGWLATPEAFERLTLMFQKEVADRLTASPGGRAWGRLGVIANWRWRAEKLFDVSPKAFVPPPKVTSSIVSFVPRPAGTYPEADPRLMEKIVAAAFNQRRKMIRRSLTTLGPAATELIRAAEAAGIDPETRAERLTIEDFCRLARLATTLSL